MARSRGWFIAATIFTAINILGAPLAILAREWMHLTTHVVLAGVGALFMWRFAGGSRRADAPEGVAARQLSELQQSVDAIALEVERIGESQRFAVKMAAKRAEEARDDTNDPRP